MNPDVQINLAQTDAEIAHCYPVMAELRPHLVEDGFVTLVRRLQGDAYRLAFLTHDGAVKAVAGFRIGEMLARGRHLYVDDLSTTAAARSQGHGGRMLDWLIAHARAEGCDQFHLDSGVQRFDAHRFYFRNRMHISSYHFLLDLHDGEEK